MRLFFAADVTNQVRMRIAKAAEQLQNQALQGYFVRPELYHITLVFLGETSDLNKAVDALQSLEGTAFTVLAGGLGTFKRPRGDLYWAGVQDLHHQLQHHCHRLSTELKKQGFSLENRSFRPHITIGRDVILAKKTNVEIPEIAMKITQIRLMNSERINGRLTYTEIAAKHLNSNSL